MRKPLFAFALAVHFYLAPAHAGDSIVWMSSTGLFGKKEILEVPSNGGSAPSVLIGGGEGKRFFATGAAARNLAEAMEARARAEAQLQAQLQAKLAEALAQDQVTPPPTRPAQVAILADNRLIGGMTELLPGTGIYLTARHILQNNSPDELRRSFRDSGLELNDYRFYQFLKQGKLDAILAVPAGKEGQILELAAPEPGCAEADQAAPSFRLRRLPTLDNSVELNDSYFSYQYGTSGKDPTVQLSEGRISMLSLDRLLLPLKASGNNTTARSSGSLVFTSKPGKPWKFGGVIECILPPTTTPDGVPVPGAVRALPATLLLDARVAPIRLERLLVEGVEPSPDCVPIDGRDAGGD
ncbi:MAG: hypothetical protein NDJ89_00245 [Oligoflexia bacterium]|nr:hypothetical protein [Oligoflexia bacterium]